MPEFASKGVAGTALGLGAGSLGLQLLNGGLGGLLNGGAMRCGDEAFVNRYEAAQQARISELETEVKLRDANTYTIGKVGELRDYVERKFDRIESQLCEQRVYNATLNSAVSCIQGQVAQLQSLTKLVVPNQSVCPGWGDVTVTPAAAAAGA